MPPRAMVFRQFAVCLGLVLGLAWSVDAQGPVVSLARASALKASYPFVRFSTLSSFSLPEAEGFTHVVPGAAAGAGGRDSLAIPPDVLALHGRPVSVRGFMLPIDVNADGVQTFILTSSIDSCHWGMMGFPNEWLLVEMAAGARVPFLKFQPVTVFGKMSVEPSWRGTRLSGLYQIRADYLSADGL